jgi:hypothetical protein
LNTQLYNPASPGELQSIGNVFGSLIGKGSMRFTDDTGSASLNPLTGQFEVMGKNFGLGITPNPNDLSAELKFQFGREQSQFPGMMNEFLQQGAEQPMTSAARAEFENQMNRYTTNNPYWYRP